MTNQSDLGAEKRHHAILAVMVNAAYLTAEAARLPRFPLPLLTLNWYEVSNMYLRDIIHTYRSFARIWKASTSTITTSEYLKSPNARETLSSNPESIVVLRDPEYANDRTSCKIYANRFLLSAFFYPKIPRR